MSEPEFKPGDRVRYTTAHLADLIQREIKVDPDYYTYRTGVVVDDAPYRNLPWALGKVWVAWKDLAGIPYPVTARALEVVPDERDVLP